MTKEELIDFEKDIANEFCNGKIHAPIHLSDGNEDQLIEIFKMIKSTDWVYSTWRSHFHALLHGIPKEVLRDKCLAGDSITVMVPEYKFFSSAIVGGILPIAMGTALGIKRQNLGDHVWVFIGDMTARTGGFHEVVTYAENFDLPIDFVIEDNGESVGTPTKVVWGEKQDEFNPCMPYKISDKVWCYRYKKKWPHVGAGQWVTF